MARGLLKKVSGWLVAVSLVSAFGMVWDMNGSPFPVAAGELETGSSSREGPGGPSVTQEKGQTPLPTGDAVSGQVLYDASCVVCHGAGATGGIGPRLAGNPILSNDKLFWDRVLKGRHMMPPLGDALSAQQIADIQAWLKTLR
jgi:cytochrome c oxidase cbb3-type subunit 3